MKVKTWCTWKDAKLDKMDRKYIKNSKIIKDEYRRQREAGEIDLLKIPRDKLIYIFNNMDKEEDFRYKHNYDNENARRNQYYYDITDEMDSYDNLVREKFNIDNEELFELFKNYLIKNNDKKDYNTFTKILNATCKLNYIDYDDYEYSDYEEHERPFQEDVDHNYVGTYELVVMEPIPLEIIQNIKDTVEKLDKQVNQVKEVEKEI